MHRKLSSQTLRYIIWAVEMTVTSSFAAVQLKRWAVEASVWWAKRGKKDVFRSSQLKILSILELKGLNGPTQRWIEKPAVIEFRGGMILFKYEHDGAHFQAVFTEFIYCVVHMRSDRSSYVKKKKKRAIEREARARASLTSTRRSHHKVGVNVELTVAEG